MTSIIATWSISLDCECPHCHEIVNLLDYCDFWDGVKFKVCEYDTELTTDREVVCPECMKEFDATFSY